jgi:C-mannosyltransferase DPY19L
VQLRAVVLSRITFRPIFILAHLLLFVLGVFGIKALIGRLLDIRDDDHIFDILRSKFTDFANFHTRLYTCAVEFDFISTEA